MANFGDEIVIKDPTGKLKILRGGQFYDLEDTVSTPAKTVIVSSDLAERILRDGGFSIDENLKDRFREIIEAYKKDVRDKFETKSIFVRKVSDGGIGLTSEQADLIIKLVGEIGREKSETQKSEAVEFQAAKIKEGAVTVYPAKATARTPVRSAVLRSAISKPSPAPAMSEGVAEFVFSPADEAEILAHAEKLPRIMAGMKPVEVAKIINSILKKSKINLDDASRQKLEKILLTNFKDVRDGFETEETLRRTVESAGLVIAPEQIDNILKITKESLKELEEKLKQAEFSKIKQAMETEKKQSEDAWQSAEAQVKEKIDERWGKLAKKEPSSDILMPTELISPPISLRPKASAPSPFAPASVLKEASSGNLPRTGVIQEIRKVETEKKVNAPGFPTIKESSVSLPKVSPEGEPKPLEILKPVAPPTVRRPLPPRDNRPRLDDVKYVPKLVGPIEELREMTIVDFRRLAPDPAVATAKIIEKLRLLEKESITKKIDGIKAWQESEVNIIYKEISREALLKGMPANQVSSLRASANQPTLAMDEYQAVMELNRALRY